MAAIWHLIAPDEDPRADAVQLILRARALPVIRDEAGPLPVLIPPGGSPVDLHDHEAVFAALPPSDPPGRYAPGIPTLAERALTRLAMLDPGAFPADLDLVIFALRQDLRALDALLAPQGGVLTGTAEQGDTLLLIAPLLWRIGLLDRHFDLFLLSGLPGLAGLQHRLLLNPLLAAFFDVAAELRYLRHLRSAPSPQQVRTDWSRALGPEGREKSLLPRRPRRKYPSIGSNGHIR